VQICTLEQVESRLDDRKEQVHQPFWQCLSRPTRTRLVGAGCQAADTEMKSVTDRKRRAGMQHCLKAEAGGQRIVLETEMTYVGRACSSVPNTLGRVSIDEPANIANDLWQCMSRMHALLRMDEDSNAVYFSYAGMAKNIELVKYKGDTVEAGKEIRLSSGDCISLLGDTPSCKFQYAYESALEPAPRTKLYRTRPIDCSLAAE
jgi:hypothetical protein